MLYLQYVKLAHSAFNDCAQSNGHGLFTCHLEKI